MGNTFTKIIPLAVTTALMVLSAIFTPAARSEAWRKDKPCGHQLPGLVRLKMEGVTVGSDQANTLWS